MNEEELTALLSLTEQGIVGGIAIYKKIAGNLSNAKPLADVLASADAAYDQIAQTAIQEGAS